MRIFQNDAKTNCEISVAIEGNIEAWIYRATPSVAVQWQQCWGSNEAIIARCVDEGPNNGWWNGAVDYQYYQLGFRERNAEVALHEPFPDDVEGEIQAGANVTCGAAVQPAGLHESTCRLKNGTRASVEQILRPLQRVICANQCGYLDIDDMYTVDQVAAIGNEPVLGACEITVGLPNRFEAFGFRAGSLLGLGVPAEDCDPAFDAVIDRCYNGDGSARQGGLDGNDGDVFFKAGVRTSDDRDAIHNGLGLHVPDGSLVCGF